MPVATLSNALIYCDPTELGAEGPLSRVKGIRGLVDLDENLLQNIFRPVSIASYEVSGLVDRTLVLTKNGFKVLDPEIISQGPISTAL